MRCHICNAVLSEKEIQINRDHGDFDPCGTCLEVIDEVFSNEPEEVIDEQIDFELLFSQSQDVTDMEEDSA
jgi:cytidine deaminase